ncbi:MAG: MBL fold metallo-hydrolase [Flavisolibacter sp.]
MSLFITSIASGSNGNCYYVGNEKEAVLVDAGVSCREIESRMRRLGLLPQKIKAVFISHEHSDHIRGVPVFVKKYQLPTYITAPTLQYSNLRLEKHLVRTFNANEAICIGDLLITAFSKFHDAADPYSFVIACKGLKVGVFTDIGLPCQNVIRHFSECHAAFLEANYDDEMLDKGNYPYHLKKRISGEKGHLSNKQALELFKKHKPSFMSHLILSHLSKNNNSPKLVQQLFDEQSNGVKMIVASRFEETPVYQIQNSDTEKTSLHYTAVADVQLELSFF